MRNCIGFLLIFVIVLIGCGSGNNFKSIEKDSDQYAFFESLAKSIPSLDPEKNFTFVKTNQFDLDSKKFLFYLYQELYKESGGQVSNYKSMTPNSIAKFVKEVAQNLVQRRLILMEANEHDIEISSDTLQAVMQRLYNARGGKEQFIKEEVEPRGISLEYLENDARENYVIAEFYDKVVYGDIKYNEQEVRNVYTQDKKSTVRHIFMVTRGISEAEKQQVRAKMESILKKAKEGADFAELAKSYSQDVLSRANGGLLEDIERGTYLPEIDQVAFTLPVGAISDIFESKSGLHILQIVERKGDPRPYEVAKKQIIARLTADQRREAYAKFEKMLNDKYEITIIENPGQEK
ncbi:peptidylprolyl isomerase [candidate division KSB1 bacterium]|nr:peptidylprolyl isomerase [candidate division KSB1 bacterium]